jgi:hypothetical protein
MSLAYEISQSGDQVRVVGKGKITTRECIGLIKHVMTDRRCHLDAMALVDLRDATYETHDLAEVVDIARTLEKFASRLKSHIAIVARQSLLLPTEILATHVRKATHAGIRVFVDLAAAKSFLQGKKKASARVR